MNDLKEIGGFIVSADPFVQHDSSVSGNGTVESPLSVVPGYNETVLWSGSASNAVTTENPNNFNQLRVCVKNTATPEISTFTVDSSNTPFGMLAFGGFADSMQVFGCIRGIITSAGLSIGDSRTNKIGYSDGSNKTVTVAGGWVYTNVIGINRKANN